MQRTGSWQQRVRIRKKGARTDIYISQISIYMTSVGLAALANYLNWGLTVIFSLPQAICKEYYGS